MRRIGDAHANVFPKEIRDREPRTFGQEIPPSKETGDGGNQSKVKEGEKDK